MTKQEIIDALTALAASLDAIKDSSTNAEFRVAYRTESKVIDEGSKALGRT